MPNDEWTERDVQLLLVNPIYAINVDPSLCVEHPPMVSKADWVRANARLIEEIGAEAWLECLLEVLETGGLKGDEGSEVTNDPEQPLSRQQRRLKERRLAKRKESEDGR